MRATSPQTACFSSASPSPCAISVHLSVPVACPDCLFLGMAVYPSAPSYSIGLCLIMHLLPPHSNFPPKKTTLGDEMRPPPKPPRLYLLQEPTPEEMPVSGSW